MNAAKILLVLAFLMPGLSIALAAKPSIEERSDALSDLIAAIKLNASNGELPAEALAHCIARGIDFGIPSEGLERRLSTAITSYGNLKSIRSAEWTDARLHSAFTTSNGLSATFSVDHERFVYFDFAHIVDEVHNTHGLLNAIIQGWADDPLGPLVDIEKDLLCYTGHTWIFLNERSEAELRWLIAISINDRDPVSISVSRFARSSGAQLVARNHYEIGPHGIAITDEWLVFGAARLVRDTTDKLQRDDQ